MKGVGHSLKGNGNSFGGSVKDFDDKSRFNHAVGGEGGT